MRIVFILSFCFIYNYARRVGRQPASDEPFHVNHGLYETAQNAAIEAGQTFSEEQLEQELLNSIEPTKAFKGTIVARHNIRPPSLQPLKHQNTAFLFNEDKTSSESAEDQENLEGSAENIIENNDDEVENKEQIKNKKSDVQLPSLLGLSGAAIANKKFEAEMNKTLEDVEDMMIDITSGTTMTSIEDSEEDDEGSGSDSLESSIPFDLAGFGEGPISSKISLSKISETITQKKNKESSEDSDTIKISGEIGRENIIESDLMRVTPSLRISQGDTTTVSLLEDDEDTTTEEMEKKPTPSGTFLEDDLLPIFLRKKMAKNRDHSAARRGAIQGCPAPVLCGKNCFIALDSKGCQTCECLWQALSCETNDDCPESIQICDLGKCECSQGFEQDMDRSGMCKPILPDVSVNDEAVEESAVQQAKRLFEEAVRNSPHPELLLDPNLDKDRKSKIPLNLYYGEHRKHIRVIRSVDKLRRPERLQWPDKPIRRRSRNLQRDSIPDSFIISNDEDDSEDYHDDLTSVNIPTATTKPRGLLRFVSDNSGIDSVEKQTERTTISPPTTNNMFEITSQSLFDAGITTLSPLSTVKILGDTGKSDFAKFSEDYDLPPAPPPAEIHGPNLDFTTSIPTSTSTSKIEQAVGSVSRDKISRTFEFTEEQRANSAKSFTKVIELPKVEVLKPIFKKRGRKQQTEVRAKAQGVETVTEINDLEFPISAQLKKLKDAGIELTPPPALSAKPTDEELKGHEEFMRAMHEQRVQVQKEFKIRENPFSSEIDGFSSSAFLSNNDQRTTEGSWTTEQATTTPVKIENQKAGVWYDMETPTQPERRRSPTNSPSRLYMEYTEKNVRGKPIRVEGRVIGNLENECDTDRDCGPRFKCCTKQWCDQRPFCGKAKFCLPNCTRTKLVNAPNHSSQTLDIVYD